MLGATLGLVHNAGDHDLLIALALENGIDDRLPLLFVEALVLPVGAESQVAPKRRLPVESHVVFQGLGIQGFIVCKRRGDRGEDALESFSVA